jgi:ABC-type multidrug transport system ATPase subunit
VAGLKEQVRDTTAVEVTVQKETGPETRHLTREALTGEALTCEGPAALVREALAQAESEGHRVLAIHTIQPTLEDVFVELTGLSAEEMQVEKNGKGK